MERYTMSFGQSIEHKPEHPDRTARRPCAGHLNFDVEFGVWTNRAAMARTIRMQQTSEPKRTNWKACVTLTDVEGY